MKKNNLLGIGALILACFGSPAAAEDFPLIDGNLLNGNFEIGTMEGWSYHPRLAEAPQEIPATEKHGSYLFPVKFPGQPGGRAVSSLLREVSNVDPVSGRNFRVQFDTREVSDRPSPRFSMELIAFDQDQVAQAITFQSEGEEIGSDGWTTHTLTSTKPLSEDWGGGRIQFRIHFYKDDGSDGEFYETQVDNVRLIQMP